jgi:tRNA threonylcarbamoyladenosine modification (KEOPS) complex Cgi121 subunit
MTKSNKRCYDVSSGLWGINPASDESGSNTVYGFGRAYEFPGKRDLRKITNQLPEGIVICSPSMIAGEDHLLSVLIQSAEYWNRRIFLAKNKSIDLLMRITCQNQISKAIEASGLESCDDVCLFGLARQPTDIFESERKIEELGGRRMDKLLDFDPKKERFLRQFHMLPSRIDRNRIPQLLQEKSAMLVFPK